MVDICASNDEPFTVEDTEFGTIDVEITFVCCCTLALNVSVYMVLDCPDVVQDRVRLLL